jgi:hypothetical protein
MASVLPKKYRATQNTVNIMPQQIRAYFDPHFYQSYIILTYRRPVFDSRHGRHIFLFPQNSDHLWGPPSLLGSDAVCSPPSSVEAKNEWSYRSAASMCPGGAH